MPREPEQHVVYEREDGRVSTNPKRQRAYRSDGKDRCLSQQTDGVSELGEEIDGALDGRQWARVDGSGVERSRCKMGSSHRSAKGHVERPHLVHRVMRAL